MRPSQIVAVDHVELEGSPAAESDLLWLYAEMVGLARMESWPAGEGDDPEGFGPRLRFRSGNIELRYHLRPDPETESVACRLTVAVPSLAFLESVLQERSWEYQRIRGLGHTDRRLSMLDPAGNRIEIKQDWPWSF